MKKWKVAFVALLGAALATPAMAFNVEWHGDLNNRFSFSDQADLSKRTVKDSAKYVSIDGSRSFSDLRNAGVTKKSKNDSDFFGELKYRMWLQAADDENKVKGVVAFEFGSSKFGGEGADFGGDDNVFELRWAYTDIEVPFDSASRLTVGLQPVGYNALLWSDNAAGVKWKRKSGSWAYSLGWFRDDVASNKTVGGDEKSDYDDAYAADVTYAFENGSSLNAFMVFMDSGQVDSDVDDIVTNAQDSEIWLGLSGKGKWGALSASATGIYLTGELSADEGDYDRKAFLFHGQLDYTVGANTFSFGGLYASGDDDPNDGDLENFDVIDISTSMIGSVVIFDNYADDNSFSQAPYVFDQGYKLLYAGLTHKLNNKTKLRAKYLWHNTAEDTLLGDDEIGHEFVAGVSYTIMKGLKAEINAGYLIGGDAWDALGTDGDSDDVFRTDARLRYKF
ncbi:MAG: hypothetical protein PWP34_561 [Desulfuromonadales bacterium]|nr:hypothetical protein [Desulfuromonadales bacterium]